MRYFSDDESRLNMIDRIVHTRPIPVIAALIPVISINMREYAGRVWCVVWFESYEDRTHSDLPPIRLVSHRLRKSEKA